MRVLVVGPVPPPVTGDARVTEAVVTRLREAGADLVVVDASGRVGRTPYHVSRTLAHLRAMTVALRTPRGRLTLYLAGAGGLGTWYQVALLAVVRRRGHRMYFHHHSYAHVSRRTRAMAAVVRAGGPTLEHVALCDGMAERIRELYPGAQRVRTCSNAGLLPEAPGQPSTGPGDGPLVLGHLGNLTVEKGLATVLATLRALREAGVPARLRLAGPAVGPEPERLVREAVDEFGDALDVLGPVHPDEVPAFHDSIDVFLFPSTYANEAEPLVVLEAARQGVPTLAFRVGCVGALVPDPAWVLDPDEDYPAAATGLLGTLGRVDAADLRARVRAHFVARRTSAVAAQERLCAELVADDAPAS